MAKNKKKIERRSYGGGTIFKRKDGRYGAAASLGNDENGKRIRLNVTGKTEEEVQKKMKDLLQKMEIIDVVETTTTTIDSKTLVEDFIKEFKLKSLFGKKSISTRTYENYEYSLNHFEEYFKGKSIGSIDTSKINKFFKYMQDATIGKNKFKYSQVSLNRVKYTVERMFKRGLKKKYILENPFDDEDDFKEPESKQDKKEILALTKEELIVILNILKNNQLVYPVIMLMLNTAMRTQEVLGLKWKNIDLANGIIQVRKAITLQVNYDIDGKKINRETKLSTTKKGSGDRDISITEGMVSILIKWKKEALEISKTGVKDDDYVFGNSQNTHWTYSGFRVNVNRYIKRNTKDINGLCLHRIRHTVATILAEDGATLFEIMQLLGHTQGKTTMKYVDRASKKIAESNKDRLREGLIIRLGLD